MTDTVLLDAAWAIPVAAICAVAALVLGRGSRGGSRLLLAAQERLRGKLSYTNLGFALAPPAFTMAELRDLYSAALGHQVSATNLQRVLLRRRLLEDTGDQRHYGRGGGRPATLYRFRSGALEITDQFAVLRPPKIAR